MLGERYRRDLAVRPGELEAGDEVLFKVRGQRARRVPLLVREVARVEEYVGSIYVRDRATLDGPAGGLVLLERTGTGRIRARQGEYAPGSNVQRLWRPDE